MARLVIISVFFALVALIQGSQIVYNTQHGLTVRDNLNRVRIISPSSPRRHVFDIYGDMNDNGDNPLTTINMFETINRWLNQYYVGPSNQPAARPAVLAFLQNQVDGGGANGCGANRQLRLNKDKAGDGIRDDVQNNPKREQDNRKTVRTALTKASARGASCSYHCPTAYRQTLSALQGHKIDHAVCCLKRCGCSTSNLPYFRACKRELAYGYRNVSPYVRQR